jgi:N,N-dimethylformamidase
MKRPVDHGAMSAVGYTTPWSARPGEQISLSLSCDRPIKATRICRIDTPALEFLAWPIVATGEPAGHRQFDQGSFLRVSAAELAKARSVQGIRFELFLTRNLGARTILETGAFRLCLRDGAFVLEIANETLFAGEMAPTGVWLTVELDLQREILCLRIRSHDLLAPYELRKSFASPGRDLQDKGIYFGASAARGEPTLNAKFAAIRLSTPQGTIAWDFPTLLPTGALSSSGRTEPLLLHVVNQPTFCVTSARWDGSSFDPRLVPLHYDAVHCHDDDIGPLQWPACFRVTIPLDACPGVYAFQVEWDGGYERVVFFVTSSRSSSPLLYLVPTATYLAYADEYLPDHLYEWKCDDRGHRFAIDNNLKSLYDYHTDLSGVSICSYKKPKATLRDDYAYPLCGCPHNLPIDLHFLKFCHGNGIVFDVITDHDLHLLGMDGLRGHRAVVTGSHPEYMSIEMEQALRQFVAEGGSLAYLGGNGFAAAVAFKDDLMELRRSPLEAGRTWDGSVAEQSLSITNEPGGYLRSRGRGEFSLIGGAISLMGFDCACPFTRTDESYEPGYAWLFEGVENATFGSGGIVLGGAAGYEVDATDPSLGTSADTIVIARAAGFPDSFFQDPTRWYAGGDPERTGHRCAEMTLRNLTAGGLIFSASSVAWCGALPVGGIMNDVGRITLNLLNRISGSP